MLIKSKHSGYLADGTRTPFGGGKGGGAPAPDPRIGEYYGKMGVIADEAWQKAKGMLPLQEEQMRTDLENSKTATKNAADDRTYQLGRRDMMDKRYDESFAPLEEKLAKDAAAYNEEGEQERMAQQAGEDVAGSFAQAGGQVQRGLAARGISAGSGAAIAALNDTALTQAMTQAAAVNKTRQAAKDIGWTKLGEAAALGKGLVGFGMGSNAAAGGSNAQFAATGTAGTGIVQGGINGINSAGSGAASIYGSAAGGLNNLYGNQINAYKAESEQSDPFGAILGKGLGAMATSFGSKAAAGGGIGGLAAMFSDRRLKTDIRPIGKLNSGVTVYSFRYKIGGPTVIGVMADEVEKVNPDAVTQNAFGSGYAAVNYAML